MPIRVKCSCGKALSVKDELAGKKVKCPGCASAIPVPKAAPAPAPGKQAVDEDDEDGTPYDLHALDKGPTPEEIEEAERKRKKRIKEAAAKAEEQAQTDKVTHFIVCGVGIVILIVLGVAPFLNWFSLSDSGSKASVSELYPHKLTLLGGEWDKAAKAYVGASFFLALAVGVGLVLYGTLDEDAGGHGLTVPCCLALLWAIGSLIWTLGFFWWWCFVQRYKFEEATKTMHAVRVSVLPDTGMIVALVAAALVAGAFTYSLMKRHDTGWCYLAQFLGVAFGAAMIYLNVKPW